jgi:hypothetical protein
MKLISSTPERSYRLAIVLERRDALTQYLALSHSEWERTGDHFAFNDMMLAFAGRKQLSFQLEQAND